MTEEVYAFALKTTLNEIRNACPGITHLFMFKEDGEIIAGDEKTPEKTMVRVVDAFDGILEKAEAIGGVEGITLDASKGRVYVSKADDIYLVTVTSKKADIQFVNTVTRVLVPTVLKLLEKISPTPLKDASDLTKGKSEEPKPLEKPEELMEEAPTEKLEEDLETEIQPEPPMNQLIVENLGGLLVPSDTVRIDREILSQWEELYEGRKIEEVEIETFDGKLAQCKVKPIKNSKYEGKGIIQMPEKIQSALEIRKGELVRVKPLI